MTPILTLAGFFLVLGLVLALRVSSKSKFEIRNSDVVLALVPVGLVLFLTGQIRELGFGDFKIVAAIEKASKEAIPAQGSQSQAIPFETLAADEKGGDDKLEQLVRKGTKALAFRMASDSYVASFILRYIRTLLERGNLQYVVLEKADASFHGLLTRDEFIRLGHDESFAKQFVGVMRAADAQALLQMFPGLVPETAAILRDADRRSAMERMAAQGREVLPVLDEQRRFVGILDRSRLTSILLADIVQRLETRS